MFSWIRSLFMSSTADAAFEMAIYSAGIASGSGMHQTKEPENLQEIAKNHKSLKRHASINK